MLILYLAVLIAGLYFAIKNLIPEMKSIPEASKSVEEKDFNFIPFKVTDHQVEKLDLMLAQKNRDITFLQKELRICKNQISSFEKIKAFMEEEIKYLREQNRIFRSELGLPAFSSNQNSVK